MRFLHVSDLHLGRKGREEDIWRQWKKVVDIALEERPEVFLITGDVFDNGEADVELKKTFCCSLQPVIEQGTEVLIIPGNHDLRQGNALAGLEKAGLKVFYQYDVYFISEVAFHLFPFASNWTGQDLVKMKKEVKARYQIGAAHASYVALPEIFADLGDSQAIHLPLTREDIMALNFDYFALGHYHNAKHWQVGNTQCVYPGSIEPLSFKEKEKRCVFLVECGEKLKVTSIPIGCQRFYAERILQIGPQGLDALWAKIEELSAHLGPCFLRLTLRGMAETVRCQHWQSQVSAFLEKRQIKVFWQDETVDLGWIEENTLAKQFLESCRQRGKKSPDKDYWWRVFYRGIGLLRQCQDAYKEH